MWVIDALKTNVYEDFLLSEFHWLMASLLEKLVSFLPDEGFNISD